MLKPTASRSHNSSTRQAAFCEPPVKRPHYFTGQILSADDFTAEQEYHIGKQRRHNLHCHGFGVVHGLKVSTLKKNARWTVARWESAFRSVSAILCQLCLTRHR